MLGLGIYFGTCIRKLVQTINLVSYRAIVNISFIDTFPAVEEQVKEKETGNHECNEIVLIITGYDFCSRFIHG